MQLLQAENIRLLFFEQSSNVADVAHLTINVPRDDREVLSPCGCSHDESNCCARTNCHASGLNYFLLQNLSCVWWFLFSNADSTMDSEHKEHLEKQVLEALKDVGDRDTKIQLLQEHVDRIQQELKALDNEKATEKIETAMFARLEKAVKEGELEESDYIKLCHFMEGFEVIDHGEERFDYYVREWVTMEFPTRHLLCNMWYDGDNEGEGNYCVSFSVTSKSEGKIRRHADHIAQELGIPVPAVRLFTFILWEEQCYVAVQSGTFEYVNF